MFVAISTALAQMDQERLELVVRQMDLIDVPVVIPATTCRHLPLIIINVESKFAIAQTVQVQLVLIVRRMVMINVPHAIMATIYHRETVLVD